MTALVHRYEPRGVCAEIFDRRDPEILISGPAGTGKSRACLEKIHAMALANPGLRGLFVRKTRESLTSTALATWRRDVIPESVEAEVVKFYGGGREKPPQYQYDNGSVILLGGMDNPTKIMSSEFDVIYVQEATELTIEDWESLTTRLRNNVVSFQQILADTNPTTPKHWLKQRCSAGTTLLLESRHEDNPTLYDDDGELTEGGARYMEKLDALTGPRYDRLRRGLWVGSEGTIYPEFDPAIHVVDRYPVPEDWTRWWAVDFGFVHPFVCQMWAEDPDGGLVMYREFYGTRRLVSEWANLIMLTVAPGGEWAEPKPMGILRDHDAEGGETFDRIIGQGSMPANKQVLNGIQAVQTRLKDRRVTFMRNALHSRDAALHDAALPCSTVEEFPGYIWKDDETHETPVKQDDHGMDTTRYLIAHHDVGARPNMRWLTSA